MLIEVCNYLMFIWFGDEVLGANRALFFANGNSAYNRTLCQRVRLSWRTDLHKTFAFEFVSKINYSSHLYSFNRHINRSWATKSSIKRASLIYIYLMQRSSVAVMQSFDVKNLFFRFVGATWKWCVNDFGKKGDDVFWIIFALAGISFASFPVDTAPPPARSDGRLSCFPNVYSR